MFTKTHIVSKCGKNTSKCLFVHNHWSLKGKSFQKRCTHPSKSQFPQKVHKQTATSQKSAYQVPSLSILSNVKRKRTCSKYPGVSAVARGAFPSALGALTALLPSLDPRPPRVAHLHNLISMGKVCCVICSVRSLPCFGETLVSAVVTSGLEFKLCSPF